ncbi:MAG: hypothetical protein ATN35_04945 [Epulopiscium sp. Nele67-Bin004]|nr:MAG: hypothetical protein ATN35_04945 [Epulopiscium sp. Nele67-Bin004]
MHNNNGFTLIECMVSCMLVGIIIMGMQKLSVFSFVTYNDFILQETLNNQNEIVYYFLKNRFEYSKNIKIYVSDKYQSSTTAREISYKDAVTNIPLYRITYDLGGSQTNSYLYSDSSNYKLVYQTQTVQAGISTMTVSKNANSSLITISYTFVGSDEINNYIVDLNYKGLNDD